MLRGEDSAAVFAGAVQMAALAAAGVQPGIEVRRPEHTEIPFFDEK